jgi:hypothetical protein
VSSGNRGPCAGERLGADRLVQSRLELLDVNAGLTPALHMVKQHAVL